MQGALLTNMAEKHYQKVLKSKAFNTFLFYTQKSLINKLEKSKGEEIYKIRMFRKVITAWKFVVYQRKLENQKVYEAREKLNFKRKLVLMRKWKEYFLAGQVRKAQNNTAMYLYKKKLFYKAFEGLKLFKAASKFENMRWENAMKFEKVKLLTTAFKSLHWYKNKKKALHEVQMRTDAAYIHLTKRSGFKTFVNNMRRIKETKTLNQLAKNFYDQKLREKYLEILRSHKELQKGLRDQEN